MNKCFLLFLLLFVIDGEQLYASQLPPPWIQGKPMQFPAITGRPPLAGRQVSRRHVHEGMKDEQTQTPDIALITQQTARCSVRSLLAIGRLSIRTDISDQEYEECCKRNGPRHYDCTKEHPWNNKDIRSEAFAQDRFLLRSKNYKDIDYDFAWYRHIQEKSRKK